MIINHLTERGMMDPALLDNLPFTDVTPRGPDGLVKSAQVDELVEVLQRLADKAVAA
jgi:type I restriction enzyme R subunit